jgi:imidazolonepropionase-like amidohydrolase
MTVADGEIERECHCDLLLAAGLTPMDVLRAGTQHAAWVCGHGDELGTLEPGKLADVIVVDGDPLADIEAMGRVVAVVKGGEIALP